MKIKQKRKRGFTLIELVVVIAIMSILALIIVPNLTAYIQKGDDAKVQSNLKNAHTAANLVDQSEIPLEELGFKERVGKYANITKPSELAKYSFSRDKKNNIVVEYDGTKYSGTQDSSASGEGDSSGPSEPEIKTVTYEKYSIVQGTKPKVYNGGRVNFDVESVSGRIILDENTAFFEDYEIDYRTGDIIGIGQVMENPMPEDVVGKYALFTYVSPTYNMKGINKIKEMKEYYTTKNRMIHMTQENGYMYSYPVSGESIDIKGDFIESLDVVEGTFPNDGIKDGFWYVKK